ncbi:hypothetical protein C5167_000649 [Papaver somniferum]|uniref:Uncharacterized protein n=1 Tax=Papaver somniferum TaxID=3469 RepID=A0A4Y7KUM5_PAPSO|nr:hypothetical protein C5167_000649 [Papaver somniferum]
MLKKVCVGHWWRIWFLQYLPCGLIGWNGNLSTQGNTRILISVELEGLAHSPPRSIIQHLHICLDTSCDRDLEKAFDKNTAVGLKHFIVMMLATKEVFNYEINWAVVDKQNFLNPSYPVQIQTSSCRRRKGRIICPLTITCVSKIQSRTVRRVAIMLNV